MMGMVIGQMQEMSKNNEYAIMVMVGMVMKDRLIKGKVRIMIKYTCKMGRMMMRRLMMDTMPSVMYAIRGEI